MIKNLSLKNIRNCLKQLGIEFTDDEFNCLSYADLAQICCKAEKVYSLNLEIKNIINEAIAKDKG